MFPKRIFTGWPVVIPTSWTSDNTRHLCEMLQRMPGLLRSQINTDPRAVFSNCDRPPMNSLAWNEHFHSNDKEDCIFMSFYWSALSQHRVACVSKYNPIPDYFPLDVSVDGAFECAYPIISSPAASEKERNPIGFARWTCVMCEGFKSSLFICRLPAALLISLHSQDKREAIVTVEPETCCHGDSGKVCARAIIDAVAKTWWLAAVLVYPRFERARQFDLSSIPSATDGLDRYSASDVSASLIRKSAERVTGRRVCAFPGNRISHLSLTHVAAFSFHLSRSVMVGLVADSAARWTLQRELNFSGGWRTIRESFTEPLGPAGLSHTSLLPCAFKHTNVISFMSELKVEYSKFFSLFLLCWQCWKGVTLRKCRTFMMSWDALPEWLDP